MKLVKRILLGFLIIFCLFTLTGFIIAYLFEDEVKTYMIDEINKQLVTQIEAGSLDFSVLRKFPYASLMFSDVICPSAATNKRDTLFTAKKIFLQFNILDVFSKNYRIKKIQVNDALVNIIIDKNGDDNYHFWKSRSSPAIPPSGGDVSFEVNEMSFDNVLVSYQDQNRGQDISFNIDNILLGGKFASANYSLYVNSDLFVHHIKADSICWLEEKPFIAELELTVNENNYHIKNGTIEIDELPLYISGEVIDDKISDDLDLVISGKNINIQTIISVLPEKYKKQFSAYKIKGDLDFESFIRGKYSGNSSPSSEISFMLNNGEITQDSLDFTFENIALKGIYKDGFSSASDGIEIKEFSAQLGDGNIKGNFRIDNFLNPTVTLSVISRLRLADAYTFFKTDTIQNADGDLNIDASFKGKIKQPGNYTTEDIRTMKISGIMDMSDIKFQFKGNPLEFYNINGALVFNDNDIFVNDLIGKVSNPGNQIGTGTDFQLEGYFKKILSYILLPGQKLFVDARLKSGNIDLNEVLHDYSGTSAADTAYLLSFPADIDFNLDVVVDKLSFRRFSARDIKGTLKLKDKKLLANSLAFSAMDGEALANGVIDGTHPEGILITCDATLNKIDIRELFYEFENFGQDFMKAQHLKGSLAANIQFASVWSRYLSVDLDKVYAIADLTITKGELINFEPMMELSKFIDVSELKHIKFSALQNRIEIKNREIHIPRMEIKSSALNITASGVHTFNNDINYKFRVFLPELLAKKARKAKRENDEFGVVEDDGLGMTLHLLMTGTVDDPFIKYDKKGAIEKFREDLKAEKQTLKTILNEEFGWFKKDTAIIRKKEKFDDDYFIIEWDEDATEEKPDEYDF